MNISKITSLGVFLSLFCGSLLAHTNSNASALVSIADTTNAKIVNVEESIVHGFLVTLPREGGAGFEPTHYEIQRYQTGSKFETIATIPAVAGDEVVFSDKDASGVVFYRMRYIGAEGQQYFSSTSRVVVSEVIDITIATDSDGRAEIQVPSQYKYEIARVISGDDGAVLEARRLDGSETAISLHDYTSGVYLVELTDVYGIKKMVKKVVKL